MTPPIRFRTGPEIQRLKQEIENYIKRYIPDATVKFINEDPYIMTAQTKLPHSRREKGIVIQFNERYLEWMPRDKVFEVVNHEIAHVLHYYYAGQNYRKEADHGPEWHQHAKILGVEESGSALRWWDWLRKLGINTGYPRFLFKCRACGVKFYTGGFMDRENRLFGEPRSHPLTHKDFWVWDLRSGRRGVLHINNRGDFYDEYLILKKTKFEGEE